MGDRHYIILNREPVKDEPPAPLGPAAAPPLTWPEAIGFTLAIVALALAAWFDEELGWWAYDVWLIPAAIAGLLTWRRHQGRENY